MIVQEFTAKVPYPRRVCTMLHGPTRPSQMTMSCCSCPLALQSSGKRTANRPIRAASDQLGVAAGSKVLSNLSFYIHITCS